MKIQPEQISLFSLIFSYTVNSSTRELRRVVWCGLRGLRSQGNWIELQIGTEFLVGLQAADDRGFPFYKTGDGE